MYYVYALYNKTTNKIYIGQTADLNKRLKRHNFKLSTKRKGYTYKNKGQGRWVLVYKEGYKTRKEAVKREQQ